MILSIADTAYIAGVVDGEGSIGMSIARRPRCINYVPYVHVTNTQRSLLEWIEQATKLGSIVPHGGLSHNPRAKAAHRWVLGFEEIQQFLPVIVPYLRIKGVQAELVLEFLALRKGNYHSQLTDDERVIRSVIYQELRELNHRGI